ncbi:DUF5977 domain-containing protein [Weeksellaceae bacterium A-14]
MNYIKHVILLLFVANICYSQNQISNLTPASPIVSSLIKFAEVPVDNYNGTAAFNIPLYEINEGDFNFPLSANYYSTGLKVEEEASNIGLGWTLNAGGVIHMTNTNNEFFQDFIPNENEANQNPDDDPRESSFVFNYIRNGYTFYDSTGKKDSKHFQVGQSSEYHLFIYNFNGITGKFIEDKDHKFVSLDKNNIIFEEYIASNESGFKAITPDGIKYYFTLRASTSGSTNSDCLTIGQSSSASFYLTRIETPKNTIIKFLYGKGHTVYAVPHLIQTFTKNLITGYSNPFGANWNTTGPTLPDAINAIKCGYSRSTSIEYSIKEINSDHTKIVFESSAREDFQNGEKIDKIRIYSINGSSLKEIRTINFNYNYFNGNIKYGDYINKADLACDCFIRPADISENYKSKRLKLISVSFGNGDLAHIPTYHFCYNNTLLPYKTSLAQDLWGYFNGETTNKSLLPNVNDIGYKDDYVPFYFVSHAQPSIRKSAEDFMKAGILTDIIQPTGGVTNLEFEINKFSSPSIEKTLIQTTKSVQDFNSTSAQSIEFTIPSITNQLISFSMSLTCNKNSPCNVDIPSGSYECAPYKNSGLAPYQTTHPNDIRLYGIIEKKIDGKWQLITDFSRNNPDLIAYGNSHGICGLFEKDMTNLLSPGEYKMTANYPDNKTGFLGGPWVNMKITYFEEKDIMYPNEGAGLRIKRIANYDRDGTKNNEKLYIYNGGVLMTRPVFYRIQDHNDTKIYASSFSPQWTTVLSQQDLNCTIGSAISPPMQYNVRTLILNSDAVIPYSYNAHGSLVGYNEVRIKYGENVIGNSTASIGEEQYFYNNLPDYSTYYPSRIAGLPETRYLRNGTLKEKNIFRLLNVGSINPTKELIRKEKYDFIVKDQKRYWAYKAEYLPLTFFCPNNSFSTSSTLDYNSNFLHFYHIKTGTVLLNQKEETEYIEGKPITKIHNYIYNKKKQLITEEITENNGDKTLLRSYFPHDMLSGDQSAIMTDLINSNRIDLQIRQEKKFNGKEISASETFFAKDVTTSDIILPKKTFRSFGNFNIDKSSNTNLVTSFDLYNNKGNLLQFHSNNGGYNTVLIWGYNGLYPIAKIVGKGTYPFPPYSTTDISQNLINNITSAANSDIDDTTELSFITALDNMRRDKKMEELQITTYTHDPLVGITSLTLPTGIRTKYYYDLQNRLKRVTNEDGQLIKEFDYNYQRNDLFDGNIYYNSKQYKVFSKDNCPNGYTGNTYIYIVPEGTYMSFNSQVEADNKAIDDILRNGQDVTNRFSSCGESCPFTPSSFFNIADIESSIIKNDNLVKGSIKFNITLSNLYMNWKAGVVLGSISGSCALSNASNTIEYYDSYSNTKWRIIINPLMVFAQLLNGTVTDSKPIYLEFSYNN